MEINVINNKSGCRAVFYFNGHTYTCYGKTPREAKEKAVLQINTLKGESLF